MSAPTAGTPAQLGPARIFVSKAMIAKGWSYSQAIWKNKRTQGPWQIHGTIVYLPTWMVDVFMVNVTLVNVNKYTSPMHAMGRETQNSALRWVWQSDFCSAGGAVNLFNQVFDSLFGWFTEFSPVGGWAASSCVVWRQTFWKEMMMMINFTKIVEAKRSHMNYVS